MNSERLIDLLTAIGIAALLCVGWLWLNMLMDSRPVQAIGEWLDEKFRKAMR